ncbi:DUF6881 domain-containing protein [Streptomyces galbus]|uniref:DUF6881 domain-containing protein n=1 Tax=Streptomyces galbus TaxID=33898 RepID=UPI0035E3D14F
MIPCCISGELGGDGYETRLSEIPFPSLEEISSQEEFSAEMVDSEDFERAHFVRGVDDGALSYYVDGVISGDVPNVENRYFRNGRVGYWDPDKRSVVIEDGDGGTVFTPPDR